MSMMMHKMASVGVAAMLLGTACASSAATPGVLDDAALVAYVAKPYDKATMMHTTVELGRHHGQMVVAEFPCSDVCPQYTKRIVHYRLDQGASCESVGGVQKEILVPVAITVRSKTFCVPQVIADEADEKPAS